MDYNDLTEAEVLEAFKGYNIDFDGEYRPREVFYEHDSWWARAYPDDGYTDEISFGVVIANNAIDFEEL